MGGRARRVRGPGRAGAPDGRSIAVGFGVDVDKVECSAWLKAIWLQLGVTSTCVRPLISHFLVRELVKGLNI